MHFDLKMTLSKRRRFSKFLQFLEFLTVMVLTFALRDRNVL